MAGDKRAAPERFRYWDLKEAFASAHLMGFQSGCGPACAGRSLWKRAFPAGVAGTEVRGQTASTLYVATAHTTHVDVEERLSLEGKSAIAYGCHQVLPGWRAKPQLCRCEMFQQ
jgi:hypothetical protein